MAWRGSGTVPLDPIEGGLCENATDTVVPGTCRSALRNHTVEYLQRIPEESTKTAVTFDR
jgi:hypothetical protein